MLNLARRYDHQPGRLLAAVGYDAALAEVARLAAEDQLPSQKDIRSSPTSLECCVFTGRISVM